MVRNRGPHRGIAFLPSDDHAPRRQAFLHLHGPHQPPPVPALIGREIGSGLVPGEPVQIGAPALKDMDSSDHCVLLPGLSPYSITPAKGKAQTSLWVRSQPHSRAAVLIIPDYVISRS